MRVHGMRYILVVAIYLSVPLLAATQQVLPSTSMSALTGLVVDTLGLPVPYAQIFVVDTETGTFADDNGHFRLEGLDASKLRIGVRRVGFRPVYFDLDLPVAATVDVRVRMFQTVRILNTVEVTEDIRAPLRKEGFYDRLAAGNGHFVTPEMIAAIRPVRASDAFNVIPNVVVQRRGSQTRLVAASQRCEYAIVVDKVRIGSPGSRVRTSSPDDLVSGTDIYAIEVYPRNRGLPAHFLGMNDEDGCGTIVVWTKGLLLR